MSAPCGRERPAQFTVAWRQARWHHGFVLKANAMVFNRLLLSLVLVGARELGAQEITEMQKNPVKVQR